MTGQLVVSVAVILVILHVNLVGVAYLILLERKLSAWIQDRIGPNRCGPVGLFQPIADGVKLLVKEDYKPKGADLALFSLAPMAIIIPALIGWVVIPWGGEWAMPEFTLPVLGTFGGQRVVVAGADVGIGVIFLLAVASLGVYGVTLGGWASNNKYSLFGGLRATAGMISYEIPMGASILAVLLLSGAVRPQTLIEQQVAGGWYVVAQPLAALLFFVCILAEANRAPFDNAEAEQELVGGYHTEYSSMRFGMFLLAEYAHLITSSAFLALLFLGGYHLPFVGWTSPAAVGLGPALVKVVVFFTKVFFIVSFMMLVRWTIPRVRWDQVMKLAWNALIPLGIALVVLTAALVYLEWTAWWQTLLMNAAVAAAVLAIQPLMPGPAEKNRRVPLAGSRFCPIAPEPVSAESEAPTTGGRPASRGLAGVS
ncbi:MAG: NADH-quinone oxidoreductase subunit NuoH [Planctomycetota bacterium]|nr:MAG: NADH-quinone oxidoreductase subunit NuoH [Planctomycetota bacterium]